MNDMSRTQRCWRNNQWQVDELANLSDRLERELKEAKKQILELQLNRELDVMETLATKNIQLKNELAEAKAKLAELAQKWEYKILTINTEDVGIVETDINRFVKEGWEVLLISDNREKFVGTVGESVEYRLWTIHLKHRAAAIPEEMKENEN